MKKADDEHREPSDSDMYQETMRRLDILNKMDKKRRSEQEETEGSGKASGDTFIPLSDLKKLAKQGHEFFIPPDESGDCCMSCGDGSCYFGKIDDVRNQMQSDLKANPGNAMLAAGLSRVEQELGLTPSSKSMDEMHHENIPMSPVPTAGSASTLGNAGWLALDKLENKPGDASIDKDEENEEDEVEKEKKRSQNEKKF